MRAGYSVIRRAWMTVALQTLASTISFGALRVR